MYHTPGSMDVVRKFMKPLQIGVLDEATYPKKRDQMIEEDFKKLWKTAEDMVKMPHTKMENFYKKKHVSEKVLLCQF